MKTIFLTTTITLTLTLLSVLVFSSPAKADNFDEYLAGFDYAAREEMKINSRELVELLKKGEVQFIDIRFPEEFSAWRMGFAKNIPLNELPGRLDEIDKNKLVVTACPHNDRANIARIYLTMKGYQAKYLTDGLLGLAELLRGDKARDLIRGAAR
jgi:rhodanese-related sulfurtransferase